MKDLTETAELSKRRDPEAPSIFEVKSKHKDLAELPYLRSFEVTGNYDGTDPNIERVLASQIIAAPNLVNWADEYHGDWATEGLSSVEKMAQEIKKDPDGFWENNQHPVKMTKVVGPSGPIYAVQDGSHRVAAAKLAGALEIPAEVSDLTNRKEYATTKEAEALWWQGLIESGAIRGQISQSGQESILTLDETPELPWIIRSRTDFVKVNKVYREIYGDRAFKGAQSLPDSIKDKLLDSSQLMVWENTILRNASESH